MKNKNNFIEKKAFTLIEVMISILIVSIIIISWFQALSSVTIWKTRIIWQTEIQKEILYFTQKLFEEIKKWWNIDYEEYFNRKVIWTNISSWHYSVASWFWNFWSWWIINSSNFWDSFYYCASWNWAVNKMTSTWCVSWNNQQRYWQYSFQFIDYNWNYNNDSWDENEDWNIIWDDDDEYLWDWPKTFTWWVNVHELYLISANKTKRIYFRWNIKKDENAPSSYTCNNWSASWCIWTIEYLKLTWKDSWDNHTNSWSWYLDWVIDTWFINKDFPWWWNIAWTWTITWIPLFSDTINITQFEVYPYPNKDLKYAWKNIDDDINISQYVILKLKIKPSWISRKKIKWNWKELDFSMTINLSDIYSK